MRASAATTTFMVALAIASVQSATTVKPTQLPVSSTPTAEKTTYAREHAHTPTGGKPEAKTAAAGAAATVATQKPQMAEGHVALKQKLNSIAVKCKEELRAPQEIMALVSNNVVPQNEQQRCYLECVYKNLNLVKNNKFSVVDGKSLAQIRFAKQPEEYKKAVTMIETCEKEAIVDPKTTEKCAAGRLIRNCFVKNGEKINFFPKA